MMIETEEDRAPSVARRFAAAVSRGGLDLPLPGSGRTRERWSALSALAREDLCVARLAEAHLDALAILDELAGPPPERGSRWGVWAARPPEPVLVARPRGKGFVLSGIKPWCSGARACTHALVTAEAPDGYRLFAVRLDAGARPRAGTWHGLGMAGADTLEVEFPDVPATPVGGPEEYLDRPGFWWGAIAVAACWYGGAAGLAEGVLEAGERRKLDPHALAHLGAIDAGLSSLAASFDAAAAEIDADPSEVAGAGELRAARLRAATEEVALEVLERAGRAVGPWLFVAEPRYANLLADLPVYLRQSHAERDLERLGTLVVGRGASW